MVHKLAARIVDVDVIGNDSETKPAAEETQATFLTPPTQAEADRAATAAAVRPRTDPHELQRMNEHIERQEEMFGCTYKMTPPVLDHAIYVTINDIVLNEGTTHEIRRPYEIFINSKNMEHFEWVVALTRVMSGVFRKGGNVEFLVDELKSVFAPSGGYFKPGSSGQYMNSVVAELGHIIERHLIRIGLAVRKHPDDHQQALIDAKTKQVSAGADSFSGRGARCSKCYEHAVVLLDGCLTCLSCGDSKCQ